MTFKINIYNAGPDGTIEVTEVINDNQSEQVFNDFLDAGETKQDVECKGTGRKTFKWVHKGNDHFGNASAGDGETLTVDPPGKKWPE